MTGAPRATADDVIRALRKVGFVKVGQRGSHQKWKHPLSGRIVILPYHSKKIIHPKTLATIVEGTGLTAEEFQRRL
ncbi:MAG: addiction module toxin, HicA family [Ignavibacteria bacterium]|nr:addiction module toxin, HicA family [Ignavibacteria bacterium]